MDDTQSAELLPGAIQVTEPVVLSQAIADWLETVKAPENEHEPGE